MQTFFLINPQEVKRRESKFLRKHAIIQQEFSTFEKNIYIKKMKQEYQKENWFVGQNDVIDFYFSFA